MPLAGRDSVSKSMKDERKIYNVGNKAACEKQLPSIITAHMPNLAQQHFSLVPASSSYDLLHTQFLVTTFTDFLVRFWPAKIPEHNLKLNLALG